MHENGQARGDRASTPPDAATCGALHTALRAGGLSATFDRGSGALRWLRLGDVELLRGVFGTVRPADWRTVEPVLHAVRVVHGDERTTVRFRARHEDAGAGFEWRGVVTLEPSRVRYRFDGVALSTFERNRIGLCVLHPAEAAGRPYRATHDDGRRSSGSWPLGVAPFQALLDLRALEHDPVPGVRVRVEFEGEVFETEDQRNWLDASYKTYGTPLHRPMPVRVEPGTRVRQALTIIVVDLRRGARAARARPRDRDAAAPVRLACEPGPTHPLPAIGFTSPSAGADTSDVDRAAIDASLRRLAPAHLRVDVGAGARSDRDAWRRAAELARALGAPVDVALHGADARSVRALLTAVADDPAPIGRWLLFGRRGATVGVRAVRAVRDLLGAAGVAGEVWGGAARNFTDLNREPAPIEHLDGVVFGASPQVHAFDDASILETAPTLEAAVRTASARHGGASVAVSTLTLRPRRSHAAPEADARQHRPFAAAWLLGCLRAAAIGGAASVTLHALHGPGGFVRDDGTLDPAGALLAGLAHQGASRVRRSTPLGGALQAAAFETAGGTAWWLANAAAAPVEVRIATERPDVRATVAELDDERPTAVGADASGVVGLSVPGESVLVVRVEAATR